MDRTNVTGPYQEGITPADARTGRHAFSETGPQKGKSPTDINNGKSGSDSTGPNLPQTLCEMVMGFGPDSNTRLKIGGAALAQFPSAQFLPVPLGVTPCHSFGKVPDVLIGKIDNQELGNTGGGASKVTARGAVDFLDEAEALELMEFC